LICRPLSSWTVKSVRSPILWYDYPMHPSDVIAAAREGLLPGKAIPELQDMLKVASIYQASNPHDGQIGFAISSVRDELVYRRFNEAHQQLLERHNRLEVAYERLRISVDGMKAASEGLKNSIDRPGKPHWSLWATLAAAVIAAVASVIGCWPEIAAVLRSLIH